MKYEVKVYETAPGRSPFDEWINNLKDAEAQITIDLRIGRVKLGNLGKCESVGGGVYELKNYVGPGYRVYFGLIGLTVVLLLCGGDKRTQKKDIKRAQKYLQDFKSLGVKDGKKSSKH